MRYGSVYLITNKLDNIKYVGITTTTIAARWSSHCAPSSTCSWLHNAIKKYGKAFFKVEELYVSFCKEDLEEKELYFINLFNTLAPNGYNLTLGRGFHGIQSEITCKKKSKSNTLVWKTYKNKVSRIKGLTNYINNKKLNIVSVNISSGIITRYISCNVPNLSSGTVHRSLKDGGYYNNCYWFLDKNQSDDYFKSEALTRLKGRWRVENENPIIAINIITSEVLEFSNIYQAKNLIKDVGMIRKCLEGRLTKAKNWKFKLK